MYICICFQQNTTTHTSKFHWQRFPLWSLKGSERRPQIHKLYCASKCCTCSTVLRIYIAVVYIALYRRQQNNGILHTLQSLNLQYYYDYWVIMVMVTTDSIMIQWCFTTLYCNGWKCILVLYASMGLCKVYIAVSHKLWPELYVCLHTHYILVVCPIWIILLPVYREIRT